MSSISIKHYSRIIGEQNKFGGVVLLKEAWFNIKGRAKTTWPKPEEVWAKTSQCIQYAERVFSILESSFNKKQTHSLQDYICASVMLPENSFFFL